MITIGLNALLTVMSHLIFIAISFYALQALDYSKMFKKNHIQQSQFLLIFLAILIGYNVSRFFLEFINLTQNFKMLLG